MFMILGTDYFHLKRYGEAMEQFRSAADLESNQKVLATIQYWIGVTYKAQNQPDQAIAPLREAIRLNPDDGDFYFELGTAYLAMSREADALEVYRKLRAINDAKAQELHAEILLHDEKVKQQ
jgi:tetratricopeptide (TPR) repeat protein